MIAKKDLLQQLRSCYHRCLKMFLGYPQSYSITSVLLETGMPSFDTGLHSSRVFRPTAIPL